MKNTYIWKNYLFRRLKFKLLSLLSLQERNKIIIIIIISAQINEKEHVCLKITYYLSSILI